MSKRSSRSVGAKDKHAAFVAEGLAKAEALYRDGDLDGAWQRCRAALRRAGAHGEGLNLGGVIRKEMGAEEEALDLFRRAAEAVPQSRGILTNYGVALRDLDRAEDAVAVFERLARLSPDDATPLALTADCRRRQGRLQEAAGLYAQALAKDPDNGPAHYNLALTLIPLGELAAAREALGETLRRHPDRAGAHRNLALISDHGPGDPAIAAMERLLANPATDSEQRQQLYFGLGKAYDDCGEPDRAFHAFAEANRLRRAEFDYDMGLDEAWVERLIDVFDSAFLEQFRDQGDPTEAPVFIVGMPRSGTSLVEQILASHPAVLGAGELPDIRLLSRRHDGPDATFPDTLAGLRLYDRRRLAKAYLKRLGRDRQVETRITDKMPDNFFWLGFIHVLLPNARIIHCRRDPVDTCLSCFKARFDRGQFFAYDLTDLGRFYRLYRRLMDHWRHVLPAAAMIEVDYETLVADPEPASRAMIDFLGLDWDDACLTPERTARAVHTASAAQIRQPIYGHAVGRWRRYAGHLGPLLAALGPYAPADEIQGGPDDQETQR